MHVGMLMLKESASPDTTNGNGWMGGIGNVTFTCVVCSMNMFLFPLSAS